MAIEVATDSMSDQPVEKTPGQLLYEKHAAASVRLNNCIMDAWHQLDAEVQNVWEATTYRDSITEQAWAWEQVYGLVVRELFPDVERAPVTSGCEHVLRLIKDLYAASVKPDTYDLQRDLMQRSAQDLPTQVYITPQAVMYAALNLEELGETLTAMSDAIHAARQKIEMKAHAESLRYATGFSQAADDMAVHGAMLKNYARGTREQVKHYFGKSLPRLAITLPHAVEIADGCVDAAVVNAGLTLSLGLPGTACYDNVVLSNLSKVNPETGVIDKEEDGKWIKGPNYRKPDLAAIIEPLLWKPEA